MFVLSFSALGGLLDSKHHSWSIQYLEINAFCLDAFKPDLPLFHLTISATNRDLPARDLGPLSLTSFRPAPLQEI